MAFSMSFRKGQLLLGGRNCNSPIRRFLTLEKRKFVLPPHMLYLRMITLNGEEHSGDIMACIEKHVCSGDAPVMEMRAEEGYLTKKLIAAGVKKLLIFEKRKAFRPILEEITSQYEERVSLHLRTFNDVFLEDNNIPVFSSSYLKTSIPFTCKKAWKDSPSVKVICAHSNGKILVVALAHLSKNMMYYGMGRPQFILITPATTWKKMFCNPKKSSYQEYHTAGLLFPDFYEFEVLGKIASPVFYSQGEHAKRISKEEFIVVSISPHKDLEDIATPEVLEQYLFFATQTMNGKAKHSLIIPALEKWIPGSGKELVMSGVGCFMKFTDLSSPEALRMFLSWRNHPHYNSSIFKYEYQDYLQYSKLQ